jgi:hypothetical protein
MGAFGKPRSLQFQRNSGTVQAGLDQIAVKIKGFLSAERTHLCLVCANVTQSASGIIERDGDADYDTSPHCHYLASYLT